MQDLMPVLHIDTSVALPENGQWQFRFEVRSETSGNVYVVSQNKARKFWGCSCPGWRRYRTCKHLQALGLPGHEIPYEPKIEQG